MKIELPKETYNITDGINVSTFLTQKTIRKFNFFIDICLKGKLLDNQKYPLVKNPKITVTIPVYNGGHYLYYSLTSIQNQKMKDIEIIIIDDCSTDDSIEIIKRYMKEDERIRIIKNNQNRKILYSKSIAALNARGKYIIQLDQDDMFLREDAFDTLYNEAESENLDLVQMRDLLKFHFFFLKNKTKVNDHHIILPNPTHIKSQPELKDSMFSDNNNYLLWALLIKADVYKKAVYHMWPIVINYKITFHEDYTISFLLVILSHKFKYLNYFGLIHLVHPYSASVDFRAKSQYYLSVLFLANNLFDYYIKDNPKDINLIINYFHFFEHDINVGRKIYPKLFYMIIMKIQI